MSGKVQIGEKRFRRANLTSKEIGMLLDEVRQEYGTLRSKLTTEAANQKKNEIWERIAKKITACCAVDQRSAEFVREKWGKMKMEAQQRREKRRQMGDEHVKPVEWDDIVFDIIGEDRLPGIPATSDQNGHKVVTLEDESADFKVVLAGDDQPYLSTTICNPSANTHKGQDDQILSYSKKPVNCGNLQPYRTALGTDQQQVGDSCLLEQYHKSEIEKNKSIVELNKSEIEKNISIVKLNELEMAKKASIVELNKSEVEKNASVVELNIQRARLNIQHQRLIRYQTKKIKLELSMLQSKNSTSTTDPSEVGL